MNASNRWEQMSADEREAFGSRMIAGLVVRIEVASQALDSWQLHESSQLAADNAASALYRPMTFELHYFASSALDHLLAVRHFIEEGSLPPFALYTLIRSAIESCGFALWLLLGGTLDKRVFRLVQMQWNQRSSVNAYTEEVGTHTQEITNWLLEILTETKNRRARLKQRDLTARMPRTTDLLIEIGKTLKLKEAGLTALSAWRACSGVTHGNQHFASGLMVDRGTVQRTDGHAVTQSTTSLASLSMMLEPAVRYVEIVLETVDRRSQPIPGRPAARAIVSAISARTVT